MVAPISRTWDEICDIGIDAAREALFARIAKGGPDECWEYQLAVAKDGYGVLKFHRDMGSNKAHRVAWMIANERDTGGLYVCHSCDNRRCCNPAHLWLGTNSDNIKDMYAKGRFNRPEKRRPQPGRKITREQAQAILDDPRPNRAVADEYGLTLTHVRDIRVRKAWKSLHVATDADGKIPVQYRTGPNDWASGDDEILFHDTAIITEGQRCGE